MDDVRNLLVDGDDMCMLGMDLDCWDDVDSALGIELYQQLRGDGWVGGWCVFDIRVFAEANNGILLLWPRSLRLFCKLLLPFTFEFST